MSQLHFNLPFNLILHLITANPKRSINGSPQAGLENALIKTGNNSKVKAKKIKRRYLFDNVLPLNQIKGSKEMDIVLVFEVHQPFRVREDYFWESRMFQRLSKDALFDYYFDKDLDGRIFERVSVKCYLPANRIILDLIDEYKNENRKVKVAYSFSGIFLEQCEMFKKDVLESFRQLAETGCVEFLDQTYYHSLCGLYPVRGEFVDQVELHRRAMEDLLNFKPKVFENTELLYNNAIARTVEQLGYDGIYAEGVERILRGKSPNHVYSAKRCTGLKVLLRNYRLTDDIGFRFSSRRWSEWPLTADKYASWLAGIDGECINIFPDYETFGEHHWPETGILEFLAHLPREILKWQNLNMATPSEVLGKCESAGEIDVPELGGTTSWADEKRDTSGWLGNTMQWAYYKAVRDMEPLVKESRDSDFSRLWRYFQASDHLHYMFTSKGGPGEVHGYFCPYRTPTDAFITCQSALMDFEERLRQYTIAGNSPFRFYTGLEEEAYTGVEVYSVSGLIDALAKVDVKSIVFHNQRSDFERWAQLSLRDRELKRKLGEIKKLNLKGERLRKKLIKTAEGHLNELHQINQRLGHY
jgi:alpha-amylase